MSGNSSGLLDSFGSGGMGGSGEDEKDMKMEEIGEVGGGGGNRWPRPETLALLRIRSEMDKAFRDSTLKAPLWEEVSRFFCYIHIYSDTCIYIHWKMKVKFYDLVYTLTHFAHAYIVIFS